MGKLLTYFIVIMGILAVCHYAGIIEKDGGSILLGYLFEPTNIQNMDIGKLIKDNIVGVTVGGIALGAAAFVGAVELVLIAPIAILFWNIILDFMAIYNKIIGIQGGLYQPIAILLFAVPIVAFVIVIVDWWRGRDT